MLKILIPPLSIILLACVIMGMVLLMEKNTIQARSFSLDVQVICIDYKKFVVTPQGGITQILESDRRGLRVASCTSRR